MEKKVKSRIFLTLFEKAPIWVELLQKSKIGLEAYLN